MQYSRAPEKTNQQRGPEKTNLHATTTHMYNQIFTYIQKSTSTQKFHLAQVFVITITKIIHYTIEHPKSKAPKPENSGELSLVSYCYH